MSSAGAPPRSPERSESLPRPVKLYGAVSLFNDFASEMIYPLLPAFFTGVLGAGAAALGTLDGAAEFASALVKYGAGRLADRPARRGKLVVLGYLPAALVRPLIAFTAAAWQVIGLRIIDRLGKGLRTPPRDAVIADITPASQRGRAFGLQRGLDHAGAILGPLVAWSLLTFGHLSLRSVIAASIIPGALAVAAALWAARDWEKRYQAGTHRAPSEKAAQSVHAVLGRSRMALLSAIAFFYLLRMPDTLLILRSQQLGVAVALAPLLWAAVHVIKASSSFVGGSWTDRAGPGRPMWLGWICYAILAAGMAFASSALHAWILFLALGVVSGLTESPERAIVSYLSRGRQGSGFGNYHAAIGIAALVGGVALGAAYQAYGGRLAFFVSAGAGIALATAWPFLGGKGQHA